MKEKISLKLMRPSGAAILHGVMPESILKNWKKLADEVLDKKITEWNPSLVGKIYDEWKIPKLLYKDYKLENFINLAFYKYAEIWIDDWIYMENLSHRVPKERLPEFKISVELGDGWINSMKEGEYNPIHLHTNCDLSSIFYIDDYIGDKPIDNKRTDVPNMDGHTNFLFSSQQNGAQLKYNTETGYIDKASAGIPMATHFDVKPKAGDFFIFPHWLMHSVNPFQGKGRRVTAAINYNFNFVQERGSKLFSFSPQKLRRDAFDEVNG